MVPLRWKTCFFAAFCGLCCALQTTAVLTAEENIASESRVVVLHSGGVLQGQVTLSDDHIEIASPGSSIRVRRSEVLARSCFAL